MSKDVEMAGAGSWGGLIVGRTSPFPEQWGEPPVEERARHAWILEHCHKAAIRKRFQVADQIEMRRMQIELRREPSCGPVALLTGWEAQRELLRKLVAPLLIR